MAKLASLIPPPGSNKYEIAIIAAREARRINEWSRRTGATVPGKVTAAALSATVKGEIGWGYDESVE